MTIGDKMKSLLSNTQITETTTCCKDCGGTLIGDGFTTPIRCEYADIECVEPDASVQYCGFDETKGE